LPEPKRYSLRFAPNMALNGLVAPLVVVPALTRLPALTRDGAFETVGTVAHPNASVACALAIGYMAFDLGSMLVGYEASVKANGVLTFHLYVWHHLLSILFWPVAILTRLVRALRQLVRRSECSSLWLALRGAMLSLGTINTPIGLIVQLLFVITFFGGRIVVMPDLVRAFVFADWDKVPGWQAAIAKATVPVPFALNVYWGLMIARSVAKVALGGKKKRDACARGEDGLRKGGTHCRRGGAKRGSGGDYLRLY
jgi:hypothetical protein